MGSATTQDDSTLKEALKLPYWQVNVSPEQRSVECPDFLRNLNAKDVGILSTRDEDYCTPSWEDVRARVAQNRLQDFQRSPSKLRRYLAYTWKLRQQHGSAANFLLRERLQWDVNEVSRRQKEGIVPFSNPSDIKILWNDWPYGIDERITHLVVWTKFPLEEDPTTGDLTDEARTNIQRFVDTAFAALPKNHYIWFKNWQSLKTIRQIEHFHVMVYDAPQTLLDKLTGSDVPLFKRVAEEDLL